MKINKSISRIISMCIAVICLFIFGACGVIQAVDIMEGIEAKSVETKDADDTFVTSQMDFAINMLKENVNSAGSENVLISPLSIMVALSMTANGANGDTRTEMESVLAGGMKIEELNEYLSGYISELPSSDECELKLANSIWLLEDEDRVIPNEDFLQTNADYYGASLYKAPFDNQTLKDINKWVEDKTDGMVKDILDKIDEDAIMYLVNALAFEAEWSKKYEKHNVSDGTFTSVNGDKQAVSMMNSMESHYIEDELATGFIKYYSDGYKFVALLPNEGVTTEEYVASLTSEKLLSMVNNTKYTPVEASLPKFSYEYSIELGEILKGIGMEKAFSEELADFSKLATSSRGNIFIGRVLHKTFIEVAEQGTRAGAATIVEVKDGAMMIPEEIKKVVLDRPFVYMIVENETGLPIFMGTVNSIE